MLLLNIGFLVFYFPILEYWSIWLDNFSFWPENFFPGIQSLLNYNGMQYNLANNIYTILEVISYVLFFTLIIILTFFVNLNLDKNLNKKLNWIPIVNIFSLSVSIYKILGSWNGKKVIIPIWLVSSFLWFYYKFISLPLALNGIDSFTKIDHLFFGNSYEIGMKGAAQSYIALTSSPIGYNYTYLIDLANIITSTLIYISALLTLLVIIEMKKHLPKADKS